MAKTNTIRSNSLQTNSVRLNGVEGLRRVSLQAGEIPDIPPTYTLSASVTNGKVSAKRNGSAVNLPFTANEGDTIVLEVTPNDGYSFEGWNDGNTDNPRSITMTADVVLSAQCVEVVQPPVGNYIQFEDAEVERVLMANGVSSDGVGITIEDAEKVTSISTWFLNNTTITSFNELKYFTSLTEVSPKNDGGYGASAFRGASSLREVTIPASVTRIGSHCFGKCTSLEKVTFEANGNIREINANAFSECSALSIEVDFPALQILGANAFGKCAKLTKVKSLGSVAELYGSATTGMTQGEFYGCASASEITLPSSLTLIGINCFRNCYALERIICRATTPPSLANVSAFTNTNNCLIYVPDASLEAYKTAVNWSAYADRIHPLSEIEGSPYIQFEDAEVERVLMANGVSSDGIGITKEDAASVTSISTWFKGNTAMTSFNELKYFINVKALSTSYAFSGCTNLQRVNLENIESMNSQVFNNSGIVELILPKIKSLINSALVGMKSITKVVIGASCESIEPNNIWSWGDRNSVAFILEGTTPPSVATSNNKPDWYGVKFYVPDEAVEVYKAATGWASWAGRIYPVSEYNG